ncbi:Oxidoreductase YdhF [Marinomonas gallaica]|uniref:Oxidoreductase YdhF n=1 Tax=Marinomonas gallaica TaxID=1806667 RepID=A0A1C3JPF0_9GAMM|nr:aldo/keto reductase [Marinomonas gallaica]SBT16889.1 Oxidoreductase YdhF [Marinomonas gallaica]SBT22160.1 Oxidoreductase YdhF [Marinomonas gallaica]
MAHQYHPLGFEGSRIAQGYWRLAEWGMSDQELLSFIEQSIAAGITTVDHADIYGDYQCESLFGRALALKPSLRDKLQIITKCGIRLPSKNRPEIASHRYDQSVQHILQSVDNSLQNLKVDHIELLLLHRPSPLMDADHIAEAFEHLHTVGKVRHFGVSNFNPQQFDLLQSRLEMPLLVNQVELSPLELKHFEDGTLEHAQQHAVTPMAWSPFAGGDMFRLEGINPTLFKALTEVSEAHNASLDQIALAWLMRHPSGIAPVIGSGSIERVLSAQQAQSIELSDDQWFAIWVASKGHPVP